jgi:hypothetical protein|tara:strand:- start:14 stop:226 length:213 start_codon:yes stop_codon:yes gene_type:complete
MKYKNHTITFDEGGLVKFDYTTDETIEDLKDDLGAEWDDCTPEEKRDMVYNAFLDNIKHDLKFYFKDMEF